jgi:dTDP-glucose pyrophosphorylase/CBS domain-containing protein
VARAIPAKAKATARAVIRLAAAERFWQKNRPPVHAAAFLSAIPPLMRSYAEHLDLLCLRDDGSIRDALSRIDRSRHGIVLVVDPERRLLATLTDGDLRRAILGGSALDTPLTAVLERKAGSQPVTAPLGGDHPTFLALMREHTIRHLPLLDEEGRVAGLVTAEDLLPEQVLPLQAVIMAGGFGTRLRPLTDALPKPMLPVGDKPMLELIINQLRDAGIHKVNVTTHFAPEKITDYFGDGGAFGVDLRYVPEDSPLGTAGALQLLSGKDEPLLVINGDILTQVDFRAMRAYHQEHRACVTVGVRQFEFQVPYGVVQSDGVHVQSIQEKPVLNFFINAGIYLLEPSVHEFIAEGSRLDMTELIDLLVAKGRTVVSFPIVEYWLDIGRHADYEQAQQDIQNGKFRAS